MKLFKKSLLVSAVLTAVAGCSSDDYKATEQANESAPTHGGDILVNVTEKDNFKFVYLLGTPDGKQTGEGVAVDLDGNVLSVSDLTANADDMTGIEIDGNRVGIRPQALKDQLDTGDTRTISLSYNITDGQNKVARSLTVNIEGEDAAPEFEAGLTANYTKDAASGSVDLLEGVTDADEEPLTVSNLTADAQNPFELPTSLTGSTLDIDIAAIKEQVPDGEKVTFKFTYEVNDHNHSISRELVVNVLGVKDVAGAPLFSEYFLTETVDETDNVQTYDLIQGAVDREGDAIVVSDVKLDGSTELPFAAQLEGTDLKFYPTAYLTEIQAGKSKAFEFTYKVADENGHVADGERTLTVTVNGVESNILVQKGALESFEGLAEGDLTATTSGWSKFGWENPILPQVSKNSAHTGENGVFLDQGVGITLNWDAAADRHYYYSGWFKTNDKVSNNFVHFNVYGEADAGRAWFTDGHRPWVADSTQWNEASKVFNTFEGGLPIYPKAAFQAFNGPLANTTTAAHVDDLRIVDVTHLVPADNNLLVENAGAFESDDLPSNNGEGNISFTETSDFVSTGNQALSVDTTGKSGYSADITLPLQAQSIKAGGRYMVELDIQASNVAADTKHDAFEVSLETNNGQVLAFGQVWGNAKNEALRLVLNTQTATGTPDWQAEDVNLRILFKQADTQFYVDDVTIFAIP